MATKHVRGFCDTAHHQQLTDHEVYLYETRGMENKLILMFNLFSTLLDDIWHTRFNLKTLKVKPNYMFQHRP